MQELIDGLTLYHGSYCEVKQPELCQGARYKDFGRGFYLTSSREQAISFIRTSVKKAVMSGKIEETQRFGFVSVYKFSMNETLNIWTYPDADVDWLHCIVGHRRKNTFPDIVKKMRKYDVVAGISLLLPERLQDQCCFRTDESLRRLYFFPTKNQTVKSA